MKSKIFLTIGLLFVTWNVLHAQSFTESKINERLGVSITPLGASDVIYFDDITGSSYSNDSYFSLGINYIHPLKNSWIEVETGLKYAKSIVEVHPVTIPNQPHSFDINSEITLLTVPMTGRVNFWQYFYANTGLLLDFDVSDSNSIDNQSGIGGTIGVGASYHFNFGASIFFNPFAEIHSLVPFSTDNNHQRLIGTGIRFGITYQIQN